METTPFTYLIGWTKHRKFYYGVRFKKGTSPNDLWQTYFTSSKFVKRMREQFGEPDLIQIRKVFETTEKAIFWEAKVLRRMNVVRRSDFLNIHSSKALSCFGRIPSEETRLKMSESAKRRRGEKRSEHAKMNMRAAQQQKHCVYSKESKEKMSIAAKARKRPPWSKETKQKMSDSAKKRWAQRKNQ